MQLDGNCVQTAATEGDRARATAKVRKPRQPFAASHPRESTLHRATLGRMRAACHAAATRRLRLRDYEQLPVLVRSTEARPVALIVTFRSWLPTLGVARQTVKVSAVAPTPVGWKVKLV